MKTITSLTMMLLCGSAFAQQGVAYNCFDRTGHVAARIWVDESGRYSAQTGGRSLVPLTLSIGNGWNGVYAAPGIVFERGSAPRLTVGGHASTCQTLTRYGGFERGERTWAF